MIDLSTSLIHGLFVCIPFTVFVAITFGKWPRLWLHSLPADIAAMAQPKTSQEKNVTKYVLLPVYLLILPGLSITSVFIVRGNANVELSFVSILVHLYCIWFVVHLWDLIIIDSIAMLIIDPQHPPIPGTEGARGWTDYNFHIRSFIRAVVMSALFVTPAALILSFIMS
jgi:hypothetical protein